MKKIFAVLILTTVILNIQPQIQDASAVTTWPPLNRVVTNNTRTDGIMISWDHNPGMELGCSGCYPDVLIQVKAPGSGSFVKLINRADDVTSYLYSNVAPGETYQFKIGYCGASDPNCSVYNPYGTDGQIFTGIKKLATPTSFTASDGTNGDGISLSWAPHTQQGESGFYYAIKTATSEFGPYTSLTNISTNSYLHTTMAPLEGFYYQVQACIVACSSPASDYGMRGLAAPSTLDITQDTTNVYLDWSPVSGANYYEVQRSALSPVSFSLLSSPGVSAYSDSTGDLNVTYTYRVRGCSTTPAICGSWKSGTGLRGIHAPILSAEPLQGGGIQLTWTHPDPGETETYFIIRALASDPTAWDPLVFQPIASGNSYNDLTAAQGISYIYKVRGVKASSPTVYGALSNPAQELWHVCYQLSLAIVGQGSLPSVDPTHSVGCPSGSSLLYTEGEYINLYDVNPNIGWVFDHWEGTFASDSDVAIMPASDHTVTVHYSQSSSELFSDGFESGDFTKWTRFNDGSGFMNACTAGKISGSYGACVTRGSNDKRKQLIDDTPANETSFSARFNFDINNLSMTTGERFRFMQLKWVQERPAFIVLKYDSGVYSIQLNALLDDLTKVKTGWVTLPDAPTTIEVEWQQSSGANDGFANLYLDGVLLDGLSGLDNDTINITSFRMGFTSKLGGKSISGTFYIDDVATSNGGYIGLP